MAVELVLIDTVGTGRFTDMAGAAGEHELVGGAVLLGVKQVGAGNLLIHVLSVLLERN